MMIEQEDLVKLASAGIRLADLIGGSETARAALRQMPVPVVDAYLDLQAAVDRVRGEL